MRPHISRWHTRYRLAGGAGAAVARVENGARGRVAETYAAALERMFADDPAVYVLRRVETELTVTNPTVADEAAIARRWAAATCAAVVATVTRRGDDASTVMRFDDTADYVARFLADLLDGAAWERWYYGAFSAYRSIPVDDALRRVFLDFREHFSSIVRRLTAMGRWRSALARLGPDAAREVWRTAVRNAPERGTDEQFRPLLDAALRIAGALQLRIGEGASAEALLAQYGESAPAPPDWREARALAEAVLAAFVFLTRSGRIDARAATAVATSNAVAELEWLDREWLAAALDAFLRTATSPPDATSPPAARPPAPTALQRRIVDAVEQLLATGAVVLPDAENADSERNALALFAELASAEPLLPSHPAAAAAIAWVLQARSSPSASAMTAVQTAASPQVASPSTSAMTAVQTAAASQVVASRFAGVALLTRVLLETRVAQLAAAVGAVPAGALLLSLAAEWTGESDFDDGLLFWSGFDGSASEARDAIARLAPAAVAALHEAVRQTMRDRAAFAPSLAPDPDASLAAELVRLWAHWLPGIARSTVPWLVQQFVHRRGAFRVEPGAVIADLAPAPLDVVLEMAGYLRPIACVPWLRDRRLGFTINRSLA